MSMNVVLIDGPPGTLAMRLPYDPAFVAVFKAALRSASRSWDSAARLWVVDLAVEPELLAFLHDYGATIIDKRANASSVTQQQTGVSPYDQMPRELREAFVCLYLAPNAPLCVAEASYKALAKIFHPDNAQFGDIETMNRVNDAIKTVREFFK